MTRILLISGLCAGCALGQTAVVNQKMVNQKQIAIQVGDAAELGPIGITTALAVPLGTVTGTPYSAETTTQRIQVLADGNRIEQSTSGNVARDGQGRVRRDEGLPGLVGKNGDAPHIVMIDDPVAHVHWTLDAQTKTAIKMSVPGGKNGGALAAMPPPGASRNFFYVQSGPAIASGGKDQTLVKREVLAADDSDVTKSDLGTQTIEGVAARGTRVTRTIPAGQIGNVQPIVITTESWYSPDLKVLVMSKSNDPRIGETTYKLTNIQRSEPVPTLFQPPDDYTVKNQPGGVFFTREDKKN